MCEYGSILLYALGNQKARWDGKPRTATSTLTQLLNYGTLSSTFCFTSTEARWLIRDGNRGGRGRKSEGSTAGTARKRPERPWTAARTMEVLRRCPLAIAQRLVHCAIAVSTAVLGRVTKTMSVALLLRNNPKRKKSNFRSPAPPPYS